MQLIEPRIEQTALGTEACSVPAQCTVAIADDSGTGTITDNDAGGIRINDISQNEGALGTSPTYSFAITSSTTPPVGCTWSIPWSTQNVTADAGVDYRAASGIAKINNPNKAADPATQPVVTVFGDNTTEPDETFNVNLGVATAGPTASACAAAPDPVVTKGTGVGTIKNDDGVTPTASPGPTGTPGPGTGEIDISDGSPSPATKGSDCTFLVTRTDSTGTASVDYTTEGGGNQITSQAGTLTFAPGDSEESITVDVLKQAKHKTKFDVVLSNPTGASIGDGTGSCAIKKKKKR